MDTTATLWDVETGNKIATLKGPSSLPLVVFLTISIFVFNQVNFESVSCGPLGSREECVLNFHSSGWTKRMKKQVLFLSEIHVHYQRGRHVAEKTSRRLGAVSFRRKRAGGPQPQVLQDKTRAPAVPRRPEETVPRRRGSEVEPMRTHEGRAQLRRE